jgi:hydrogenase maturation protein HypF
MATLEARRWLLTGRVQGVGFRPFVYRLALRHRLDGWIRNRLGEVEIHAQGDPAALAAFGHSLLHDAPPLARPELQSCTAAEPLPDRGFVIRASESLSTAAIHVPPDYFSCDDCLRELNDPRDRRYRYPFINCTQCGPRYTLITRLPYDRPNTSMAGFTLCPACRREYENPADRRFHAEPVACPDCGPQLQFHSEDTDTIDDGSQALDACREALAAGHIVAVKGIGGYHLMCDARNDKAIARLRLTKPRPHKPLAVMFPWQGRDGLAGLRPFAQLTREQEQLLRDPMRPIVLVKRRIDATLSEWIAPGLDEVGVFLPYSPLHHLLLADFGGPLVATSGNVSGEPVLTDNVEAESRLARVADAFLHHDRPIVRPADDPVFRFIAGQPRPLRLGRGATPLEMTLPFPLARPTLAVGGHTKNTVALAWENRVVVSPHIGDLGSARSLAVFEQTIADLQELYGVEAGTIVCDAHPGYASTRWAKRFGLPRTAVFHHHAHASALAGEYPQVQRWLVFTWDGVGFGEDGTLWGGEALLGHAGNWRRVASMRPFRLPGGERVGREPWRSAAALCWEAGVEWSHLPAGSALLFSAWQKRLNAPRSSAVGRLFDAAAALTGVNRHSSFEGQGPMWLEAVAAAGVPPDHTAATLPLARHDGLWCSDWAPLLLPLLNETQPAAERAAHFHASLARALLDQAVKVRDEHGDFTVGLSGGVFQNRLLTENALALLGENGFDARLGLKVPCNDAGLSFGQIIEHGYRQA